MGYSMKLERICIFCNNSFIAQTTATKYCSKKCNSRHYKAKKRQEKINVSNKEVLAIKTKPIEILNAKDFLTVKEVATLLNCSVRAVYYQVKSGQIKSINLGQRMTRIKRSEIDKLFEQPTITVEPQPIKAEDLKISNCYSVEDIYQKYGMSDSTLYTLAQKHNLSKLRVGKFVYYSKTEIHKYLGEK